VAELPREACTELVRLRSSLCRGGLKTPGDRHHVRIVASEAPLISTSAANGTMIAA